MPILQNTSGKLTIGEALERFRNDPNDPVLKDYESVLKRLKVSGVDIDWGAYGSALARPKEDKILDKLASVEDLISGRGQKEIELSRIGLLPLIPSGKKYEIPRKIAALFEESPKVENFEIARRIKPTAKGMDNKSRKLAKKDYAANRRKYNALIQNRLRYLKKVASKLGYTFRFSSSHTTLASKNHNS